MINITMIPWWTAIKISHNRTDFKESRNRSWVYASSKITGHKVCYPSVQVLNNPLLKCWQICEAEPIYIFWLFYKDALTHLAWVLCFLTRSKMKAHWTECLHPTACWRSTERSKEQCACGYNMYIQRRWRGSFAKRSSLNTSYVIWLVVYTGDKGRSIQRVNMVFLLTDTNTNKWHFYMPEVLVFSLLGKQGRFNTPPHKHSIINEKETNSSKNDKRDNRVPPDETNLFKKQWNP